MIFGVPPLNHGDHQRHISVARSIVLITSQASLEAPRAAMLLFGPGMPLSTGPEGMVPFVELQRYYTISGKGPSSYGNTAFV